MSTYRKVVCLYSCSISVSKWENLQVSEATIRECKVCAAFRKEDNLKSMRCIKISLHSLDLFMSILF